jgi:tetratricopeptide (TPR) repeat protein
LVHPKVPSKLITMSERSSTPTSESNKRSSTPTSESNQERSARLSPIRAASEGSGKAVGSWRHKWEQLKTQTAQRRRSNDNGNPLVDSLDGGDDIIEVDLDEAEKRKEARRSDFSNNSGGRSTRKLFGNSMESAKHTLEAPMRRLFGKDPSGTHQQSATSTQSIETFTTLNDEPPSPKPFGASGEGSSAKRRGSLVEMIKPMFKRRGTNESGASFDSMEEGSSHRPGRRRTGDHTASSGGDKPMSALKRAIKRKGTLDSGSSHSVGFGSRHSMSSASMGSLSEDEEETYADKLARLQKEADDFSKGGRNEKALKVWEEALKLAEDENDTVEVRTEMMCTIVNLHMEMLSRLDRNLPKDEISRKTKYHKQSARRLVEQIKVGDVKPYWLISTRELLEVCMSSQQWELALKVSNFLMQDRTTSVPPGHLASIHASIASMKLASNRQAEALHHLQQCSNFLRQDPKRNTEMYCNVLQLLAIEYVAQGQLDLALDALKEQLKHSTNENVKAKIYCQLATDIYIPRRQLDQALESLQNATVLQSLCEDPTIPVHMLQTKADVLTRLGKFDQALVMYEKALAQYNTIPHNPADKAKILYILGKLCTKLGHIRQAVRYFARELEVTQHALGTAHLSVSRCLHELAKLYEEEMGEYKMALAKTKQALKVEYLVLQDIHAKIKSCPKCSKTNQGSSCAVHAALQRDCVQQIRETRNRMGRIYFKSGDIKTALECTIPIQ